MVQIQRAGDTAEFRQGSFSIRRIRPGLALGDGESALGPLAAVDHANLGTGTVVRMHEHRNDEILSYMWRGTMIHEDSAGHRIAISPAKLMMMNAGRSFWHEESTPDGPVEMLQIFIRPRAADLSGEVNFLDRIPVSAGSGWQMIAGESGAPLTIRNAVTVFDAHLAIGDRIDVPQVEGRTLWLYVMDGSIETGLGERVGKGDAVMDDEAALGAVVATAETTLVAFLIDLAAPASRAGTISGR